jgi:hypothetical protein
LPTPLPTPTPASDRHPVADDEDPGDMASFQDGDSSPSVKVDNSAEARVLEAFPGAEEIL